MSPQHKRTVGRLSLVLGAAAGFFSLFLFYHFADTAPLNPQPATGHVVPQNNHGSIVFITRAEEIGRNLLDVIGIGLLMYGGYLLDIGD